MSFQRVNPSIPLVEFLPGGMNINSQVLIVGSSHMNADRFSVNLQCGPTVSPRRDDVALHLTADFIRRVLVRNSIQNMMWGPEEVDGSMPLNAGQSFTITITCEPTHYSIVVNQNVFRFHHRIPFQSVTYVTIDGSTIINELKYATVGISGSMLPYPTPSVNAYFGGMPSSIQPPYRPVPPYPGTAPYPSTPDAYGQPVNGYPQPNRDPGLMGKLGAAVGGTVVGGAIARKIDGKKFGKNQKKMSKKAMKYGLPIAGAGVGAYVLSHALHGGHHKMHFGHHSNSSSSSSRSSSD